MTTYTVTSEIEFDIEVEDGADPRDHPLMEQIADLVMEQPNGSVSASSILKGSPDESS